MSTELRICSLLPSATEIVSALGLEESLLAVTHECDYPEGVATLPRITSSAIDFSSSSSREIHQHITASVHGGSSVYGLDQEMLERLRPNLVLTQELCDVCAVSYGIVVGAVRLIEGDCRVVSLEPTTLAEVLESIQTVAGLAGVAERGKQVTAALASRLQRVRRRTATVGAGPSVFACEWLDPFFVGGHWVPDMIKVAGGSDPFGRIGVPSFTVGIDEIRSADPDVIVLMPCGYNLSQTICEYGRIQWPDAWHQLRAVRQNRLYAVDGSGYFNRPGPRLVDGVEMLAEILQPELFPRQRPPRDWQRVG